jgi:hypothetical protein
MTHRDGWRKAIARRCANFQTIALRALAILALAIAGLLFTSTTTILAAPPASPLPTPKGNADAKAAEPRYETLSLRGKVVWLGEALKRRFGIELDPDDLHTSCALETADELLPLAKDARGRGFWLDERLRDCDVELLVRRYAGSPVLKVIRVYAIKPDGKYELDYWCSVCSIPMYELKACECCQGPTELRLRPAEDVVSP